MRTKIFFTVAMATLLALSSIADAQTPLRQSTSRVVRICGAVAVGDGFTPVTTLALGTADEAEALRDNTATLDISGATFAAITGADGCYSLTLDATATNTVGELVVVLQDDSLILPIKRTFQVVEESVYDNLYAAVAVGPLTAAQVNAEADTALTDYDPPTNAELTARTLASAAYFDPAADTVANVTTVSTTTTNTDMRGTDNSFLAASAPANFSNLVITAGGIVDALVQGYLNNTIAETTANNIATNFEVFWDNANAITTNTVDDVGAGAGAGGDWTAGEVQEIRGRLGITGATAAGGNTPTLALEATLAALNDLSTGDIDARLAAYDAVVPGDLPANFADLFIEAVTGAVNTGYWDEAEITTALQTVADFWAESCASPGAGTVLQQLCTDLDDVIADTNALELRLTAARAGYLDVLQAEATAFLNCEVNTANFAASATSFACILTDLQGAPVTQESGDLGGLEFYATSGGQIRESRFSSLATTWDAVNSELQITVAPGFPGAPADGDTLVIR